MRVLLLDNYDSFTFNLAHYLKSLGVEVEVRRNDEEIHDFTRYSKIILSPGPGLPENAGEMMKLLQNVAGRIPVLGVCLGMQAIAEYLGGQLENQNCVKHGVQENVILQGATLFKNISSPIAVGLYHSWAVKEGKGDFEIIAFSENKVVMAIENKENKMYGVQFHPESVMTPEGKKIIQNFLDL